MLKYWLWLTGLEGLDHQTRLALLRRFGSPEDIYYADTAELLLTEGLTCEQAASLEDKSLDAAERILAQCRALDLRILTIQDAEYPSRLKNIYDPPVLLYGKGRLPDFDGELAVAVVGTRSCSPYGVACARKLGHGLAKGGAVVVSGLARGIDAEASHAALRSGGFTVGVVGNGLDVAYPASSRYLYEDIAASGLLLSEYPPGTQPARHHFPARNRILSGLSNAVLVVEAPERSGALITAEMALEQGRDVFAVPGPIDSPSSRGCNRLIRDGAGLAADAADILREYEDRFAGKLSCQKSMDAPPVSGYDPPIRKEAKPALPSYSISKDGTGLTDDQIALLWLLPEEEPALIDDLIDRSGIPTRRVLSALTVLEVDHLVIQHSGKRYTRTVALRK
ncbi:MAG: DNA-processing protein DprA [Oscillospiraceae bacterium]|nr:DNA-processing protein DprA [Oscillospiraceae bacterium]